jgi:hypothetical protein
VVVVVGGLLSMVVLLTVKMICFVDRRRFARDREKKESSGSEL